MNSKMIAIIAVVAMCGAALVGVGYAYTASFESDSNSVSSDTVYVKINSVADSQFTVGGFVPVYDTTTTYVGGDPVYKYDFNATDSNANASGIDWSISADGKTYTRTVQKVVTLVIDMSQATTGNHTLTVSTDPVSLGLPEYLTCVITAKVGDAGSYGALNTISLVQSNDPVTVYVAFDFTMTVDKVIMSNASGEGVHTAPVADVPTVSFTASYTVNSPAA